LGSRGKAGFLFVMLSALMCAFTDLFMGSCCYGFYL
jgi:hypothetical protein